jgi:ATP-binding cassette subfamily B protein|tara:strand:+ start:1076 stop:1681 length:606 start_codon:yes stop_codon:yes gene_type:complete
LYDPTGGAVLADGVDLREYDLDSVRAAMSVTFQDFVRYDITASDNIGLGRVAEIDNQIEIEDAAKKGGAHEVVTKLPQSYNTILGKQFDEGVDLSGGEWQQVAISRAFMSDAQVLILDEPTSALDALKEQQLYERFAELTKDRTVVFISHRFSTVRMADVIVVIEDGQAVEVGDHDSLMTKAGAYARMFWRRPSAIDSRNI